jgi:hypothetical protein
LGTSNDEWGHGITELKFDNSLPVVVKPGPNEDYLVVESRPVSNFDPELWTSVDAKSVKAWTSLLGSTLRAVEFYADGFDDVAIVLYFEGDTLSFVLSDTDLVMARALEPFESSIEKVHPRLRERIDLPL